MTAKYPNLFSKGTIGKLELKNRTVMPAMGMNQSDDGFVNDAVINHYKERAKGGVGLIMVEVTCVDTPLGRNTSQMLVMEEEAHIPGMTKLTNAIHEHGTRAMLQISHTGRGARRKITGHQPVAPSAVAMPYSFMMGLSNEEPRALKVEEIKEIEDKFANAAFLAKKAGFDGVQIHSVGYYIGEQFLSSTVNRRTDEYGGNPENRMRFHLNIIEKIKEKCGEDFPITVKLSALELGENGGITMEEGIYFAKRFQDVGVEALEVLAGNWKKEATIEDLPDTAGEKGQALGLCTAFKMGIQGMTGVPATIKMIGGGRSGDPKVGEKALKDGTCDFIFIGKELLVEPHLMKKVSEGQEEFIRPCIGCDVCIDEQLQGHSRARCSANAILGFKDNDYTIPLARDKKKVIVVGGGPGGAEAARIAAIRGHDVTLYEKDSKIGGQLHYAIATPHKQNIKPLIGYFERQLDHTGVQVVLGKEITASEIIEENPHAVICATGVMPGAIKFFNEEDKICRAKEILDGKEVGQKVVIIGGGVVGCETAELLASQGKEVTIVEILPEVAGKMVNVIRAILLGHLKHYGVEILTETKCEELTQKGIIVKNKENEKIELQADNIILATGDKANQDLYNELKGKMPNVYNVGDSSNPDRICTAVREGYCSALEI